MFNHPTRGYFGFFFKNILCSWKQPLSGKASETIPQDNMVSIYQRAQVQYDLWSQRVGSNKRELQMFFLQLSRLSNAQIAIVWFNFDNRITNSPAASRSLSEIEVGIWQVAHNRSKPFGPPEPPSWKTEGSEEAKWMWGTHSIPRLRTRVVKRLQQWTLGVHWVVWGQCVKTTYLRGGSCCKRDKKAAIYSPPWVPIEKSLPAKEFY